MGRVGADGSTTWEMARFTLAASRNGPRLVQERAIDGTVAFFAVPCGPVARRLKLRCGVPYVVSLRGGDVPGHVPDLDRFHSAVSFWRRRALRDASVVVANSESLAALARRVDDVAVEVVPNGVDTTYFTPRDGARQAAREVGAPFRFLFVGRLHRQKNPEFLLPAIAALRASTDVPFRLDVVGDGPDAAALRESATRLGVAHLVTWHGWLDRAELRERYQAADCLVTASPREGMPNAVLEAMACGLPTLASRVPGHEEVVRDGETGRLFGAGDTGEFVRWATAWLASPDVSRRLGAAARRVAESEHGWDGVATAYVGFLERRPAAAVRA